jgi:hypothetical protein
MAAILGVNGLDCEECGVVNFKIYPHTRYSNITKHDNLRNFEIFL